MQRRPQIQLNICWQYASSEIILLLLLLLLLLIIIIFIRTRSTKNEQIVQN